MNKYLLVIKIKPECRDDYIAIHQNPWREFLEAVREAGFVNEAVWYFEDQSIVYIEAPDHNACDARLRATEICKKWDAEMIPRFAHSPVLAEKIFDLNQQLDEGILRQD